LFSVLYLSVPRTLTLASGQVALMVLVAIASYFTPGSISIFMFAYGLQAVPLTIIGVSYSVAAFPTLARLHASGEKAEFVRYVETAMRHIFFWAIPATVMVIVLRAQLVRVILGAGAFSWDATRLTAAALALFIISLAAQSVTLLIARAYYAAGNTHKPLYFGISNVALSVASAVALLVVFQQNELVHAFVEALLRVTNVPGTLVLTLALGYTIGSLAQFGIGFFFFTRDFSISRRAVGALICQSFAASVIGGAVAYFVLAMTGALGSVNTVLGLVAQGTIGGVCGLAVAALVLMMLDNKELREAIVAFRRRFKDTPPVSLEATDISS
jgi:putative peptidoglycan lipid II flippase